MGWSQAEAASASLINANETQETETAKSKFTGIYINKKNFLLPRRPRFSSNSQYSTRSDMKEKYKEKKASMIVNARLLEWDYKGRHTREREHSNHSKTK